MSIRRSCHSIGLRTPLAAICIALASVQLPLPALAQSSSARITGVVLGDANAPVAQATVTATSITTNLERQATTSANGSYTLLGLPPDVYDVSVRRLGLQPQTRRVRAQIGQTLTLNFTLGAAAVTLSQVQVTAEDISVTETRNPEVAQNIRTEQVENLPANDRNFLSFALLVPGVVPSANRNTITTPGLSENNVNLFIDGASYKNDVLNGGVAGQDASKGNPFPQSAIQEFRVITQQYKAEYQKATSTLITATTKSGTNQWEGDAFLFGQNESSIARSFFEKQNPDFTRPDLGKLQFGGSVGGPIIPDKLFVFGSYEANHQDRASSVVAVSPANLALLPTDVRARAENAAGTFGVPFRSDNGFGKLTWQPAPAHRLEASVSIRDEYEIRNFGGQTSYEQAEYFNNDVYTGVLGWDYVRGNLLNEAHIDLQRYRWNPIPLNEGMIGQNFQGIINLGGRSTEQDFIQDRLTLRNDVTYEKADWGGTHLFKTGFAVNFMKYDVTKFLTGNPQFQYRATENYAFPFEASAGFGEPNVQADNAQVGLFVQDDWSITPSFLLSLGVRWDYESEMMDYNWVTPDSVRTQIAPFLTPAEQANYFTDGDDREPFYGAFQPRVGFSWEVSRELGTTLFGGFGVFYDRTNYNTFLDERYRLQFPTYRFRFSETGGVVDGNQTIAWDPAYLSRAGLQGIIASGNPAAKPEVFLLENDMKPPKAYHTSAGIRQQFGDYRVSLSYSGVRGYNRLTYFFGNRRADGSCCESTASFSNLLLAKSIGKSWYDAMYLTVERPMTPGRRWGAGLSYTLSKAETDVNGNFTLDVLDESGLERYPDNTDERHRVVANWVTRLPWEFRFSGIITLGSGRPFNARINGDPNRNNLGGDDFKDGTGARLSEYPEKKDFIIPKAWAYRNVDMRVEKDFTVGAQTVGFVFEAFNVFNYDNFSNFNETYATFDPATNQVTLNPEFATPTGVIGDSSRRMQLGVRYHFR
ncbi:MAG TPA: TonB-dependent receptor [Gemmatimonadaceae bacterium]|nr:TonB-dependent receptor [Gemmatimonadaceae bacterium]